MKSYQLGKDIQKMVDRLDTIEDQLQLLLSTRSVGSNDQNDTRSMPIRNEPPPLHEYGYWRPGLVYHHGTIIEVVT